MVGRIAETFHVLPSVAARDLDEDPEHLSQECMVILNYAEIKGMEERAGSDDTTIKHLANHPLMLAVRRNTFDLMVERRQKAKEEAARG